MAEVTIAELAASGALTFGDGYRTKRSEHGTPGYRILRVADVADGRVDLDGPDFVSDEHERAIGPKVSQAGDVLLTTKGTVGRVAIFPADVERVVYSPQLCYFRVTEPKTIHPRFLAYWFKSEAFVRQASHRANNTDMAAYINLGDIASLSLDLPGTSEQRAIAEVLGAFDDKIAANNGVAATARELARLLYDRAVGSAQRDTMSRFLTPFLGGTPSRAEAALWDGSVPWVSAKDVTGAAHGVITDTVEGISESAAKTKRFRPLPAGSVVLTARGTVGVVARLGIASAINQSCYGFVPDRVPGGCLTFVIEDASAQAKAMAHGSVFDTITMRTFDHVQVPALSDGEWRDVESVVAPLMAMTNQAVVESERLAATRDELLPLLMSGKVRVKDAEKPLEGVL